jgi:hypothetical protein
MPLLFYLFHLNNKLNLKKCHLLSKIGQKANGCHHPLNAFILSEHLLKGTLEKFSCMHKFYIQHVFLPEQKRDMKIAPYTELFYFYFYY